jgi:hypothetical protein
MLKKILILLILTSLIACGTTKKSHKPTVNQNKVNSAFEELDTEAKKERAEDLVLEETPNPQIKETKIKEKKKPTHIQEKPRPTKEKPHTIAEKKRPSEISTKKRPGSTTKYPFKDGYPIWFFNPNYDGYLGGVGVARKSNNYATQRRIAKMLAQAELSKQIKVIVNTELNLEQTQIDRGTAQYYRSKLKTFSKHQADQYLQNPVVKDEWKNPKTGELYLWLVLEK